MILEKPTLALMERLGLDAVPPISLESDAAVNELFDYVEPRDSDPRLTGLAYPLLGLIYKPRIFLPRGVGELVTDHLKNDGQVALALDHTYGDDHVKWGGATWHSSLHPMWRNSDIMLFGLKTFVTPVFMVLKGEVKSPARKCGDVMNWQRDERSKPVLLILTAATITAAMLAAGAVTPTILRPSRRIALKPVYSR